MVLEVPLIYVTVAIVTVVGLVLVELGPLSLVIKGRQSLSCSCSCERRRVGVWFRSIDCW